MSGTTPVASEKSSVSFSLRLDDSLGAMLVGLIASAILCGVVNSQVLQYFKNYGRDPGYLKLMVACLWLLDTSQLALMSHYMYFVLVTNFINLLAIGVITWSLYAYLLLSGISDLIIRLYYTRRIWISRALQYIQRLDASNLLPFSEQRKCVSGGCRVATECRNICIWPDLFCQTASSKLLLALTSRPRDSCYTSIRFGLASLLEISEISWLRYAAFGSAVMSDLCCAISVCYFLRKDKCGLQVVDTLVNRLTLYVVSTGLLTSLCAIGSFVTYIAMPHKAIFAAIFPCLSKLYLNALLAMLNSRKRLRDLEGEDSELDVDTHRMRRLMTTGLQSNPGVSDSFCAFKESPSPSTNAASILRPSL